MAKVQRLCKCSGDAGSAHELTVEGQRLAGASGRDAADAAVIVDQFHQYAARQHPFGAIGDGNVARSTMARHLEVGTQLGNPIAWYYNRASNGLNDPSPAAAGP